MTDQQVTDKLVGKVATDTVVTPGPGAISFAQAAKSVLYAVVAAVFPIIIESLNKGSFVIDWKSIGTVALSTALGYILVKFISPTQQITTFRKQ